MVLVDADVVLGGAGAVSQVVEHTAQALGAQDTLRVRVRARLRLRPRPRLRLRLGLGLRLRVACPHASVSSAATRTLT